MCGVSHYVLREQIERVGEPLHFLKERVHVAGFRGALESEASRDEVFLADLARTINVQEEEETAGLGDIQPQRFEKCTCTMTLQLLLERCEGQVPCRVGICLLEDVRKGIHTLLPLLELRQGCDLMVRISKAHRRVDEDARDNIQRCDGHERDVKNVDGRV